MTAEPMHHDLVHPTCWMHMKQHVWLGSESQKQMDRGAGAVDAPEEAAAALSWAVRGRYCCRYMRRRRRYTWLCAAAELLLPSPKVCSHTWHLAGTWPETLAAAAQQTHHDKIAGSWAC